MMVQLMVSSFLQEEVVSSKRVRRRRGNRCFMGLIGLMDLI